MVLHKNPHFIFLLNRIVVYSLPAAMSSITGNHMMDMFYLLKEIFKDLLSDLLITGWTFKNSSYLSSCLLPQRWRFQRIRSNKLQGIDSDLAYTKVSEFVSRCIFQSGSLWHPLSSSMSKNKQIFSLVIGKLMSALSLYDCTNWCFQKSYQLIHHQRTI